MVTCRVILLTPFTEWRRRQSLDEPCQEDIRQAPAYLRVCVATSGYDVRVRLHRLRKKSFFRGSELWLRHKASAFCGL
jgi:hypothetical protein